jgi:hypothetical protein
VIWPGVVYAGLAVASVVLRTHATAGLFGIATVALGLLLLGIHNAWDTVTYLVVTDTEGA